MGSTYDIALLPTAAEHTNFELRFALSTIVEDYIFSAFPGIERVITPIEGEELRLEFDGHTEPLPRYASLRFDSALTPMGRPTQGPVKVINVMARTNQWRIHTCNVTEQSDHHVGANELLFVFAIENCSIQSAEEEMSLTRHDTAPITGRAQLRFTSTEKSPLILSALLRRYTM